MQKRKREELGEAGISSESGIPTSSSSSPSTVSSSPSFRRQTSGGEKKKWVCSLHDHANLFFRPLYLNLNHDHIIICRLIQLPPNSLVHVHEDIHPSKLINAPWQDIKDYAYLFRKSFSIIAGGKTEVIKLPHSSISHESCLDQVAS
jgi:hypothetical protein